MTYLRKKKYPRNFGKELIQLVLSLPYSVQKTTGLFPLIKKNEYKTLIQYSTENDEEDISILHEALYGKAYKNKPPTVNGQDTREENSDTTDKLDYILEQINPDYIDVNILSPIDKARASFILENTISQSYEEFLDVLNSFYIHILRKTNNYTHEINEERISIEANKIFEETFPQKVLQKEAISIAINGNKGGLRYIFDQITEYLKRELKTKHISGIINDAVNPLDFEQILKLISEIMKREDGRLDEEIKDLNPQQFAEYYKEIIIEYANSKQSLNRIFRVY